MTSAPPAQASETRRELAKQPEAAFRSVERLRLSVIVLAIAFAVFAQAAGNTATDTKIDLVVSPLRFLSRSLHLWDAVGNAGQLQNQAYGYLFPIGPFYGYLHALGIAPWELQRAFESCIVCGAFLGSYLLARRMGIDTFWPAVAAGLTYALAPRILGELTSISAELMPVAALPWILLPLVRAAQRGSPRRAGARSGVALLFAGGVNAAATLAVLPVPALWLLTRSGGPRRRALIGWWLGAVMLASAWWAIPLLQLGRYSPPFLDWIETSATTTAPTSLLATLRGEVHWEAYLGPGVWPGGWILAAAPAALVATCVIAGVGLFGIALRRVPHRAFLWSCLLLGTILVTLGHAAPVGPVGADWVRGLLDGPLVPFRNVHKFDPLVRLPIALGVGHALLRVQVPRRLIVPMPRSRATVTFPARAFACLAVIGAAVVAVTPLWTNHLVSSQRVTTEPGWWASAGRWLAANGHGARALVVPGTGSPQYVWGGTVDNAMQPVATSPWTVRDGVPLTQPGYIRLLDAVEDILAGGAGDTRLAALLARSGIGYVVLANDLDSRPSASTPLPYVRATLNNSPGMRLRAQFGPRLGGPQSERVSLDAGGTVATPAVQIYAVAGWSGVAQLQPLSGAVEATGSADNLSQLIERGLAPDQPVLFGSDGSGLQIGNQLVTDGLRKREASFAGVISASVTMSDGQPYTQRRKVHDYLPPHRGPLSSYHYEGISNVFASSSGADNWAFVNRGDLNGPWSALDGDAHSSWQSTGVGAVGQWLQVELPNRSTAGTALIGFAASTTPPVASLPTEVVVTTENGSRTDPVLPLTSAQPIALPAGPWRWLRITVSAVADKSFGTSVGVSSLTVAGVDPVRTLRIPTTPASALLAFDAAPGYRNACLPTVVGAVCDPVFAASGQEDAGIDRSFTTDSEQTYRLGATVRVRAGPQLDRLLDKGGALSATASSVNSSNPWQRPGAAVDDDPRTIWQAARGDARPQLTLRLRHRARVAELTIRRATNAPVADPITVTVIAGRQRWTGKLPENGRVLLPAPVETGTIRIIVDEATVRRSTSSVSLQTGLVPVGIADVLVDGVVNPTSPDELTIACGGGPEALIDSRTVSLSVTATRADLLADRPVAATPCASDLVDLGPGEHRVALAASDTVLPASVTLARSGFRLGIALPAGTTRIGRWGSTQRDAEVVTSTAALFVVHENFNAGWQATLGGHRLRAVQVDGWQQAFVVPAGSRGTITLTFAPQRPFAIGLLVGGLGVLALVLAALLPARRRGGTGLRDGAVHPLVIAVALAGAATLLAGLPGFATGAATAALFVLSGPRAHLWFGALSGLLVTLAGVISARGPDGLIFVRQDSGNVQLLCVAALVAGALATGVERRRDA